MRFMVDNGRGTALVPLSRLVMNLFYPLLPFIICIASILECPAILLTLVSLLTEYTYSHHQREQTLQVLISSTANHKKHFQERFVPTP